LDFETEYFERRKVNAKQVIARTKSFATAAVKKQWQGWLNYTSDPEALLTRRLNADNKASVNAVEWRSGLVFLVKQIDVVFH
jgi:hypothetical protein